MLPQIALGQSQSSILANAYFENDILEKLKSMLIDERQNHLNFQRLEQALKSLKNNLY